MSLRTRDVRKAIIPRKGYTMVCIDYDQIEMRLFAHFSECKLLIDAINNGYDPHLGTAIDVLGKDLVMFNKDIQKYCKRAAKVINFGIIYGMGSDKLNLTLSGILEDLKIKLGEDVDRFYIKSSYEVLDEYYNKYPVREFKNRLTSILYQQGYLELVLDSPLMSFRREYKVPQHLSYKGPNMLIQGTAAYVMKYGMKRSYDLMIKKGYDVNLLTSIHDELIWEITNRKGEDYVLDIVNEIQEQMEDRVTFSVPMTASCKMSDISWGDVKKIKHKEK